MVTIGQLAKQMGVRTSALRYYEREGLLAPDGRTEAGYRLYTPQAAERIKLIQRAQRLGFSLADIRTLLSGWDAGDLDNSALINTAESRYLALEKQITKLLVLRHEMSQLLQELHTLPSRPNYEENQQFIELLNHVCADRHEQTSSDFMLDWLLAQQGCHLSTAAGQAILSQLRGLHLHIWQEEDRYHILVVSESPQITEEALKQLTQLETDCAPHKQVTSTIQPDPEGVLLSLQGEQAFIYARLFLALAQERP